MVAKELLRKYFISSIRRTGCSWARWQRPTSFVIVNKTVGWVKLVEYKIAQVTSMGDWARMRPQSTQPLNKSS